MNIVIVHRRDRDWHQGGSVDDQERQGVYSPGRGDRVFVGHSSTTASAPTEDVIEDWGSTAEADALIAAGFVEEVVTRH